MKLTSITFWGLTLISYSASAHYIFDTLIYGDNKETSTAAVRLATTNSPVKPVTSPDMTCNKHNPATETVSVPAGSPIGFKVQNNRIFHPGTAAIYLAEAPESASKSDGSGKSWFKIDEWTATFDPFQFVSLNKTELVTTIPPATPPGEYLARVESFGFHVFGHPETYVACAQIKVTAPGKEKRKSKSRPGAKKPVLVSIPGHIAASDASVNVNIYYPLPTKIFAPGPAVWRG